MTTPSIAFFWGDDDLAAGRAVVRLGTALGSETGSTLERWDVRGEINAATDIVGRIVERVATPVMFGGGTLAVVANVGPLVRTTDLRDTVLGAIGLVGSGNALVFVEGPPATGKGPPHKRVADAVAAAGGLVREFRAPRQNQFVAWVEGEARELGVRLGAGAAKELATRIGGMVGEGDAERRYQTRMAALELHKLGSYRPDRVVEVEDVRALVAEAVPDSVWAFTDAVGGRLAGEATEHLDGLLASTPEPVILAVLHRRIRELLEIADRVDAGEALPAIARSMKIASEYRMRMLAGQARLWSVPELADALHGLVRLDAMVKGAPGSGADAAQRRLAFTLWVIDRVGTPARNEVRAGAR
jgi:DNA polymerase III delta subunit